MKLSVVDLLIILAYLVSVTLWGTVIAGKQESSRDYFLGGKQLAWWAVGLSIVASETSTLTFISVPGLAYRSNMHFLQLTLGYFIGRVLVAVVFLPAYYRGDLETAYDFIGKRFGYSMRRFTSSLFILTRVLASAVRLFATSIPLHLITGLDYSACILLIGLFTLIYTYTGGLKAVVAMDVVQMGIYMGGAATSMFVIVNQLPAGWSDVARFATAGVNKFEVLNGSWGANIAEFLTTPYTLLGGLLGGTVLTMASHGTDQLLVQRLLGCKSCRDSQKALLLDATVIVFQFAFFLVLGLCLFAFYGGVPFEQLGLKSSDEIFPNFIVHNLPTGAVGLVIAGVLASAMGTLSSSISSLASSSYLDLFRLTGMADRLTKKQELFWSKLFCLLWGIVLIGGAMMFRDSRDPVVEIGLKIASFSYGGLLGTFLLGLFFSRTGENEARIGLFAGLTAMGLILWLTRIDFTWHTLIGCLVTMMVGNGMALFGKIRLR